MNISRICLKILKSSVVPRHLKKEPFSEETSHSDFQIFNLEISSFEKSKGVLPSSLSSRFSLKATLH